MPLSWDNDRLYDSKATHFTMEPRWRDFNVRAWQHAVCIHSATFASEDLAKRGMAYAQAQLRGAWVLRVTRYFGRWLVSRPGEERAFAEFDTEAEAKAFAEATYILERTP